METARSCTAVCFHIATVLAEPAASKSNPTKSRRDPRVFMKLMRSTLFSWRRQQQRIVDCLAKAKRGLNISAKIRHHDTPINDGAVRSDPSAIGRQGDIHDSVREAQCGGVFIEYKRG